MHLLFIAASIGAVALASQACSSNDDGTIDGKTDGGTTSSGGSSSGATSSGGSSSGGSGDGGQRCANAADRLVAKINTCVEAGTEPDSDAGAPAECTTEMAETTEKLADCYDAASCGAITGADAAATAALSECVQ